MISFSARLILCSILFSPGLGFTQHLVEPGDPWLRHQLQFWSDESDKTVLLSAWPLSAPAVVADLPEEVLANSYWADLFSGSAGWSFESELFAADTPAVVRSFADTPRGDAGAGLKAKWAGGDLSFHLNAKVTSDPLAGDSFGLDGTYVAATVGNWIFSAGWQERWWGPSWSSSLIQSTNSRPTPGMSVQRSEAKEFSSRWLSWIGPWTFVSYMDVLDDARTIDNALLWGARVGFSPVNGLEIGLSRTAQWCGSGRSCSAETFLDVLAGNDNRGVNVSFEDEPGNQLAGIDLRWKISGAVPGAVYMQWIGEDSRDGGPAIGSWLRQLGLETWGGAGQYTYRVSLDWSDTTCREGGLGFSEAKQDCAYVHPIYSSGYQYENASLGHATGGESESLVLTGILSSSSRGSWIVVLRHMSLNTDGSENRSHTLTDVPGTVRDIQLIGRVSFEHGQLEGGLSYASVDSAIVNDRLNDGPGLFIRWTSL